MLNYLFDYLSAPMYLNTLTSRGIMAFFVALILSLSFGSRLIGFLHRHQSHGQPIRDDGPQSHLLTKKGTPTMGGFLILSSSILTILICGNLSNIFIWVCIAVLVVYGLAGFVDDYVKVTKQTANAMTVRTKLLLQFITALAAVIIITYVTPESIRYDVTIPYTKNLAINLCWFYIPFAMVVIAGTSNAVNLSDGLDGLATGLSICAFIVFMILAYICGTDVSKYFYITTIPQAGEVAVLCSAVIGSLVGFLWFNAPKAKIFMGDTGSLAIGALLGTIAVMTKHEIVLAIVGGVFVVEALSVMIQVAYFRHSGGKRIFKMAPLHHHFEQLGWAEVNVVVRFWIIGFILAIIGLTSLVTI